MRLFLLILAIENADVAELADALDSGSSESNFIWVQVPSSAPTKKRASALFFVGAAEGQRRTNHIEFAEFYVNVI